MAFPSPILVGLVIALAVLLGSLVVGIRRGEVATVVNAMAAIGVASLPPVAAEAVQMYSDSPVHGVLLLTCWIAGAGALHVLGMMGLYEWVDWWDHLTHVVSAGFVAAFVYAGLIVVAPAGLSARAIGELTVLASVGVGIWWELLELVARYLGDRYSVEPVLVYYGWNDTLFDLLFDVLGAAIVVALDARVLVPYAEPFPAVVGIVLTFMVVAIAGSGTVFFALLMWVGGIPPREGREST